MIDQRWTDIIILLEALQRALLTSQKRMPFNQLSYAEKDLSIVDELLVSTRDAFTRADTAMLITKALSMAGLYRGLSDKIWAPDEPEIIDIADQISEIARQLADDLLI